MEASIATSEAELATVRSSFKTEIAELRAQLKTAGEIHVIQCCEDNDIQSELDLMRQYYEGLNAKLTTEVAIKKKEVKVVKQEVTVDCSAEIEATQLEFNSISMRIAALKMELQQLQNSKSVLTQKYESNAVAFKAECDIKGGLVAVAEGEHKTLKEQMAEQ